MGKKNTTMLQLESSFIAKKKKKKCGVISSGTGFWPRESCLPRLLVSCGPNAKEANYKCLLHFSG